MTEIPCFNCKHYNKCPALNCGEVCWVDCPWFDDEQPATKGKLEEYANKLTAGCSCDNCSQIASEYCVDCKHLENWCGWLEF